MEINCIIIEDEKPAAEILKHYVGRTPFLNLKGVYHDAVRSMPMVNSEKIDLIFLDMNLPLMSGIDFIKNASLQADIIITTAHAEFAVTSFEYEVVDYLLKPFSYERFLKAVNRYLKLNNHKDQHHHKTTESPVDQPFMFVRTNRKMVKVYLHDIVYLEAQKNYVMIVTQQENFLTYQSISEMEERLPPEMFLRIHRSFIVAVKKITEFNSVSVTVNRKHLPIGKQFSETIRGRLSGSNRGENY